MTASALILAAITGSALGWVSLPHCFGMCGPLHLGISTINKDAPWKTLTIFNSGRLLGFTTLGILAGTFGLWVNALPQLCACSEDPWKNLVYIIPALTFLFLSYQSFKKSPAAGNIPKFFRKVFSADKKIGLFSGGCAASLLPCGVLYLALANAAATSSPVLGGVMLFSFCFTVSFFLQTAILAGHTLAKKTKALFEKVFPWLTLIAGLGYLAALFLK